MFVLAVYGVQSCVMVDWMLLIFVLSIVVCFSDLSLSLGQEKT